MTYNELDTLFETISTTYMGLNYFHGTKPRFNEYKGPYPVVFWKTPFIVENQGRKGEPLSTLADIYTVDILFLDQHSGDWNIDIVQAIGNTQLENAKKFLWYLIMNEEILNNAGTFVRNAKRTPLIQKFTQTSSGALMVLELETPNTVNDPNC